MSNQRCACQCGLVGPNANAQATPVVGLPYASNLPNDVDSTAPQHLSTQLSPSSQGSCQHLCFCRQSAKCRPTTIPARDIESNRSCCDTAVKHYSQFFKTLDMLRHMGALCDVTLVCDGVEMAAHRNVLASSCSYFYTMFLGSFPESKAERVELHGIDPIALQAVVDFMYTAQIHLCRENVEMILSVANLLQMDVVKEQCCQLLQSQLLPSNCLQIWQVADLYCCYELRQKVELYIQEHFTAVVDEPDFLNLSRERLEKIISNDTLTVSSEEKVYEAVILWTKHMTEQRSQYLADLLPNVRLALLPMKYLVLQVKEEPLISTNLRCSKLVMDAMSVLMLKDQSGSASGIDASIAEVKPRVPAGVEQVMLVFGGEDEGALSSLECYSFREKTWQSMRPIPIFLTKAGCVVLNNKIYLIGGYNGSRHLRTVVVYDPFTDVFSYAASMHYIRSEVGVGVLDGKIYAVGGLDGVVYLRTAECYDPAEDRWRMIAPMPGGGKAAVGVGSAHGLLYIIGGIDRDSLVGTMECYDPKTENWTVIPGVKCPKKYVGVAELDGLLYLAGGRYSDDSSSLKVHCFDPKTNKLRQVKDMPCTFPSPSLLAYNDVLYVDGRIKFLCYNPQTDTWTELRGKSVYRHHSMAAIVNRPIRN